MKISELIDRGYRIYIAYGRYMSFAEMHNLCPSAEYIACGFIDHYRLTFQGQTDNGTENMLPCYASRIYAAIWGITLEDEMQLDLAYNYRYTYSKCRCDIMLGEHTYHAFTYVLSHQLSLSTPSQELRDLMKEGYSNNNIDISEWDPRII